ncbi:MAG: hypothetical protein JSS27_00655 [Planctomycetes bacterium]|nr:hypothetical protein [Planctomycetota bacterium]
MNVVQMQLVLHERPMLIVPDGVTLRPIRLPDDVPAYLALRVAAFAGQAAPARTWEKEDFARELSSQPWWRAERCWVAEVAGQSSNADG